MLIWKDDVAGSFNLSTSEGHSARKEMVLDSKEFELKGRLYSNLTIQNRLIPNGVTARLTLSRSKPEFCHRAFEAENANYKVNITNASLEACNVKLAPEIQLNIEQ